MNELWLITGSQHLYGEETLKQVDLDSKVICDYLGEHLDIAVVWKPVVTTPEEITKVLKEAEYQENCIGIITWMHTFSPSKMWISGLAELHKPILHLHTQFNRDLPYDTIDMDFMNLNQSAHGDREHGYLYAKMKKRRKVVVGYWKDEAVIKQIQVFAQAARGWAESKKLKVCRFGDNMRQVAVTDGNKVSAQMKFGWNVDYYGIGDLAIEVGKVRDQDIRKLMESYKGSYQINPKDEDAVREQAKYEIALKGFMNGHGFGALTTNFEDLHGLNQLPGLAVQRLMEAGFGFGAEGDWKTAAMLRVMKVMSGNRATAFMEDYTYHLEPGRECILGAHMLEVCPTIADGPIQIRVEPLSIGGKQPPARMVFEGKSGDAILVSLIELDGRFRLIVAEAEGIKVPKKMPRLPVAGVMWKPKPNFHDGVKAWLLAGGAHHTVISYSLTKEHMVDFARMADIECVVIDDKTDISRLEQDLIVSDLVWERNQ